MSEEIILSEGVHFDGLPPVILPKMKGVVNCKNPPKIQKILVALFSFFVHFCIGYNLYQWLKNKIRISILFIKMYTF